MKLAAAALALFASEPVRADPLARWQPYIAEASTRFGVPVVWIERIIRAESAGKTMLNGRPITSRAGAMGLMQLMPATWAAMRADLGLGRNPHDPRDNILAGARYLRLMYDRFGYPGLFAAYNAGPGLYARHLATGAALPSETRTYLAKVAVEGGSPSQSAPPPLFFALSGKVRPSASTLFVTLSTAADHPQ